MRLDIKAFTSAAALIAAVQYLLCAAAVALFPGVLTRIVGLMIHIDLAGIDRAISWTSFGIGLVAWVTLCAASAVAFAAVYNRAVPS